MRSVPGLRLVFVSFILSDSNHSCSFLQFAGVFANPSDHLTLSKHENEILKSCLIKPSDLATSFKSVGGLEKTKQVIEDLIRLPLLRPDLFSYGVLRQNTTGLLLFGPPGTGKTLLAKSIAAESGANFLNIQQSNIQSKWVGENEKNVKAIFSLARKLKPCVIFVDEIDALLRVRAHGAPHWVTNTINEWMLEWDGINSKGSDGIIVVGATNRPFDLDEAVLRRLPRRLFVGLPNTAERGAILKLILAEEIVGSISDVSLRQSILDHVTGRTEGFSGSDLKNLCIAAALVSVRRVMQEKVEGAVRVLRLEDFDHALESGDVVPSLNEKAELMKELVKWDKMYGIRSAGKGVGNGNWGF
ncbi:P-loop containing nucleoside triphosphate hydrolase protein [Chytriomyces sp. MP71]|nr:P-loop containing nucleoside triphosphate hydrolase protein [Chytriomyces sp. MP71]